MKTPTELLEVLDTVKGGKLSQAALEEIKDFIKQQASIRAYTYDLDFLRDIINLFNSGELADPKDPTAPVSDRVLEVGLNLAAKRGDSVEVAYSRMFEGIAYLLRNGNLQLVTEGEHEGEFIINQDSVAVAPSEDIDF